MSDTVKLIIEIPKEDYEFTKGAKTARVFPSEYYVKLILNGIPLDDVKAEIEKPIQEEGCYIGTARIQADTIKWCLEILDNIGKAESEDCRNCEEWEACPCGKKGHDNETSQGHSIGECKDFKPQADSEIHCNCTDEEIAKSFISDVEAVKDLLPRTESEDK